VADLAIEIAAPAAAAATAVVGGQSLIEENDEKYASHCGPAPIISRAVARLRFAIAALAIVITSIYHWSPDKDTVINYSSYTVSMLADNLLHFFVVYTLCKGSFGERRRALLAYCLLE
ncbi:hypothetical protein PENTCL1PPCAC_6093, partial [Pristionchus entomophagus]